jgi:hypothetical protein
MESTALSQSGIETLRRRSCLSLAKDIEPVLQAVCVDRFILRWGVLLEHAPGTRNPTTWVDCLVVLPFGVFVVSHYHWAGSVTRTTNDEELLMRDKYGIASIQTSPSRRATSALRYLRAHLNQYQCPVEYVAVFPDRYCTLDPALPEAVLQIPELYHFLRVRLSRFYNSRSRLLDVQRIVSELHRHCVDWGEG